MEENELYLERKEKVKEVKEEKKADGFAAVRNISR